ncbi:MAG: hypothetical protein RLY14_2681 [Planctomycetota bacterium]|jgi:hypothetical protein
MATLLVATCMILLFPQDPPTSPEEKQELVSELKIFEPLLGKTFRGKFANSTPEKPVYDVSHWERALNGRAVRILHSVNDGEYGGETMMMWNEKEQRITYWYFTTAGFVTQGHFEINGQEWASIEKVTGNKNGITEVKATSTLKKDGSLHVVSKYLKDNAWVPGHEIHYFSTPEAVVKFR